MRPYDQAIAYLDHEIANLLSALEARGLLASTLVIITSDHGEAFGEHGVYGHGSTLYLDMLQVPLVMAGPAVPAGLRVPSWVSLQAVAPTVMDLVAPGRPQPFPGQPLTRFWRQPSAQAEPVLAGSRHAANNPPWYPTSKGTISGLIDQDLMYIREADGRQELFDLRADPAQRTDLAPADARTAAYAEALTARVGPPLRHPRAAATP
jgi:arylsulfatase A-like enzyme